MQEDVFYVSAPIDETFNRPYYLRYKTKGIQIGVATSLDRAVEVVNANVIKDILLVEV